MWLKVLELHKNMNLARCKLDHIHHLQKRELAGTMHCISSDQRKGSTYVIYDWHITEMIGNS